MLLGPSQKKRILPFPEKSHRLSGTRRKELLDCLATEKAVLGLLNCTRSQTRLRKSTAQQELKVHGRCSGLKEKQDTSFQVTLADGDESV